MSTDSSNPSGEARSFATTGSSAEREYNAGNHLGAVIRAFLVAASTIAVVIAVYGAYHLRDDPTAEQFRRWLGGAAPAHICNPIKNVTPSRDDRDLVYQLIDRQEADVRAAWDGLVKSVHQGTVDLAVTHNELMIRYMNVQIPAVAEGDSVSCATVIGQALYFPPLRLMVLRGGEALEPMGFRDITPKKQR